MGGGGPATIGMIDAEQGKGYLRAGVEVPVSDSQDQRIAREEGYWTAPRLFAAGIAFLAVCVVVIYTMASFAFANTTG